MSKDLIEIENKTITYSKFRLYDNGIEAIGNPSFDDWVHLGEYLKNVNGAVHFWIGDWLNFGESKYGETYASAIDETGYDYQTLSNDKWVSRRVPISRRRENLSFSHHQEIADLEPEEQEEMLSFAVENKLNRNDFRKVVRNYKLRLDLPNVDPSSLVTSSPADFKKAQEVVIMLIEATDEVKNLRWENLNKDASDYLLAQLRKTVGILGGVINGRKSKS